MKSGTRGYMNKELLTGIKDLEKHLGLSRADISRIIGVKSLKGLPASKIKILENLILLLEAMRCVFPNQKGARLWFRSPVLGDISPRQYIEESPSNIKTLLRKFIEYIESQD
jgi:hypothetical protein